MGISFIIFAPNAILLFFTNHFYEFCKQESEIVRGTSLGRVDHRHAQ